MDGSCPENKSPVRGISGRGVEVSNRIRPDPVEHLWRVSPMWMLKLHNSVKWKWPMHHSAIIMIHEWCQLKNSYNYKCCREGTSPTGNTSLLGPQVHFLCKRYTISLKGHTITCYLSIIYFLIKNRPRHRECSPARIWHLGTKGEYPHEARGAYFPSQK